jgi:hypothetical protein
MTGHARSHPEVAHARALGEVRVVEKPVTVELLSEVIEGP